MEEAGRRNRLLPAVGVPKTMRQTAQDSSQYPSFEGTSGIAIPSAHLNIRRFLIAAIGRASLCRLAPSHPSRDSNDRPSLPTCRPAVNTIQPCIFILSLHPTFQTSWPRKGTHYRSFQSFSLNVRHAASLRSQQRHVPKSQRSAEASQHDANSANDGNTAQAEDSRSPKIPARHRWVGSRVSLRCAD